MRAAARPRAHTSPIGAPPQARLAILACSPHELARAGLLPARGGASDGGREAAPRAMRRAWGTRVLIAVLLCAAVRPCLPRTPALARPERTAACRALRPGPAAPGREPDASRRGLLRLRGGAGALRGAGSEAAHGDETPPQDGVASASVLGSVWKHLQAVAEAVTPAKGANGTDSAGGRRSERRARQRRKKRRRDAKLDAKLAHLESHDADEGNRTTAPSPSPPNRQSPEFRDAARSAVLASPNFKRYTDFQRTKLAELRRQHPDAPNARLQHMIGELWQQEKTRRAHEEPPRTALAGMVGESDADAARIGDGGPEAGNGVALDRRCEDGSAGGSGVDSGVDGAGATGGAGVGDGDTPPLERFFPPRSALVTTAAVSPATGTAPATVLAPVRAPSSSEPTAPVTPKASTGTPGGSSHGWVNTTREGMERTDDGQERIGQVDGQAQEVEAEEEEQSLFMANAVNREDSEHGHATQTEAETEASGAHSQQPQQHAEDAGEGILLSGGLESTAGQGQARDGETKIERRGRKRKPRTEEEERLEREKAARRERRRLEREAAGLGKSQGRGRPRKVAFFLRAECVLISRNTCAVLGSCVLHVWCGGKGCCARAGRELLCSLQVWTVEGEQWREQQRQRLLRQEKIVQFRKDEREAFPGKDKEPGAGGAERRKVPRLAREVDERQASGMRGTKRRHADDRLASDNGASDWGGNEDEEALEWGSDVKSDLFREDGEVRGSGGGSAVATGREGKGSYQQHESLEDSDLDGSGGWRHEGNVEQHMKTLHTDPLRLDVLYKCWCALLLPGHARHVEKVRVLARHMDGDKLHARGTRLRTRPSKMLGMQVCCVVDARR